MPVMVWGMIVPGKRCGADDWLIAGSITVGVMEFLTTDWIPSSDGSGAGDLEVQPDALHQSGFLYIFFVHVDRLWPQLKPLALILTVPRPGNT